MLLSLGIASASPKARILRVGKVHRGQGSGVAAPRFNSQVTTSATDAQRLVNSTLTLAGVGLWIPLRTHFDYGLVGITVDADHTTVDTYRFLASLAVLRCETDFVSSRDSPELDVLIALSRTDLQNTLHTVTLMLLGPSPAAGTAYQAWLHLGIVEFVAFPYL